jgi:predicted nucleic acid-binding protein
MFGTARRFMRSARFLDTNILIHAAAGKQDEPRSFAVAAEIVRSEPFGVSGRVLAEFYVIVRTKPAIPLSAVEAERWVDLLCNYPVAAVDDVLVRHGIAYAQKFQISYWDAAIIAAAERLEAPILYTEDLNDGQLYGSVRVINPFRPN